MIEAAEEIKKALDKNEQLKYNNRFGPDRFSRDMAAMFAHNDEELEVRQLHLEWAIDRWAEIELQEYVDVFNRCYEKLSEWKGKFQYNDLDNCSYIVDLGEEYRAFTCEDQNRNFLYIDADNIWNKSQLSIYRYWKRPSKKWRDNEVSLKHLIENKGIKHNDLRDRAWIINLDPMEIGRPNGIIYRYSDFKMALFDLDCLEISLQEAQ